MIRVRALKSPSHVEVTGAASDVAVFYCVWQQKLWDTAFSNFFGHPSDCFTQQFKDVTSAIREGRPVILANDSDDFANALKHAKSVCEQFTTVEAS